MTRHYKLKLLSSVFLLLFIIQFTFAEFITDPQFGYSLDIPEGYELTEITEDTMTIMFTHPHIAVTFLIKLYDKSSNYKTSQKALEQTMDKIGSEYECANFKWSDEDCSLALFNTSLKVQNGQKYSGWSVAAPLQNDAKIVLICYAPEEEAEKCQDFMISTINSLSIKEGYYNIPGIITTFAYPQTEKEDISLSIADKKIKSSLYTVDSEAAQFVIDMEYRILNYYGQHNLWMDAWQRYYRMIYRDSYGRLKDFAKEVLNQVYPIAIKKRPDNPDIQYAQYILSWVQTFEYVRAETKVESDFTNLPSVLKGEASDCDNRSLLVSLLLEYAGIDSMLLISPTFAHAMVATDIEAPGQTFQNPENKRNYIVGETTAPVTWGMMAKDQADRSQWFIVTLPD